MTTADRRGRELKDLLRQCIECGLCLPHCATWLATGNEVQSPRGRLMVLGQWLQDEPDQPPDSFVEAMNLCIGCRACETTCPSGVPYDLLAHGQVLAEGFPLRAGRISDGPTMPAALRDRLDRVGFLRLAGRLGRIGRSLLRLLAGRRWQQRLQTAPAGMGTLTNWLGTIPTAPRTDAELLVLLDRLVAGREGAATVTSPVEACQQIVHCESDSHDVALFTGCANASLLPAVTTRLVDLLRRSGRRVEVTPGQDCCGALAAHTARPGRASFLRRRNREAFASALADGKRIVVEAAGCGLELRDYGGAFSTQVNDAVSALAAGDLPSLRPLPLRVAIHDPCHLRHGLQTWPASRTLLARIPTLEIIEPDEPEVCCGSGGAWGLDHPDLSADIGRRKARILAATGADLVVTSNPGCLGQIAAGLAHETPDLPILPLTDLIWYACHGL